MVISYVSLIPGLLLLW